MKIKSKLLILFCIVLTFSLSACSSDKNSQTANAPSKSSAAADTPDGTLTYDISDGVLTIHCNGDMPAYADQNSGTVNLYTPWYDERNSINKIVLTEGITSISLYAFGGLENVREVEFCDSIKKIEKDAFQKCKSLSSVTLPKNCTEIGSGAFSYCFSLKEVTLPDNIKTISERTFDSCTSLESIVIPDSVNEICEDAFLGCEKLSKITIPASVKDFAYNNFRFSTGLTICAPIGSYAESFAKEYNFKFEPLN